MNFKLTARLVGGVSALLLIFQLTSKNFILATSQLLILALAYYFASRASDTLARIATLEKPKEISEEHGRLRNDLEALVVSYSFYILLFLPLVITTFSC